MERDRGGGPDGHRQLALIATELQLEAAGTRIDQGEACFMDCKSRIVDLIDGRTPAGARIPHDQSEDVEAIRVRGNRNLGGLAAGSSHRASHILRPGVERITKESILDHRPCAVRIDRVDGDIVLAVSGEVDINGATELKQAFDDIDGHRGKVIIDLLLVSFMDSMGLGTLIEGRNRLESDGAAVLLVSDNGPAGRLLALTKLDESFPVFDSVASARDAS